MNGKFKLKKLGKRVLSFVLMIATVVGTVNIPDLGTKRAEAGQISISSYIGSIPSNTVYAKYKYGSTTKDYIAGLAYSVREVDNKKSYTLVQNDDKSCYSSGDPWRGQSQRRSDSVGEEILWNNQSESSSVFIKYPLAVHYGDARYDLIAYPCMTNSKNGSNTNYYPRTWLNAKQTGMFAFSEMAFYTAFGSCALYKLEIRKPPSPDTVFDSLEEVATYKGELVDWYGMMGFSDIDYTTDKSHEFCGFDSRSGYFKAVHIGSKLSKRSSASGGCSSTVLGKCNVYQSSSETTTSSQAYDTHAIYGLAHIPTTGFYIFYGSQLAKDSAGNGEEYRRGSRFNYETFKDASSTVTIEQPDYSISFDANGGTGAPAKITRTNSETFGDITGTVPTRSGYVFKGWGATSSWSTKRVAYTTSTGGSVAKDGTKATITSSSWSIFNYLEKTGGALDSNNDLKLYAQWEKDDPTLTVNPNGGTWNSSTSSQTFTGTTGSTKTIANPTRSGYTFNGWSLSGYGSISGTTFTYGTGAATLTATWTQVVNYKLHFNGNGSTGGSIPPDIELGTAKSGTGSITKDITTAVPTRTGYTFNGWYTATSGGTKVGNAGAQYTPNEDIPLHAQWSGCKVTYNANGGSVSTSSATYAGSALTLPTPTKTGYKFNGWYTASSGGSKVNSPYTPNADIILYAQWTGYTVTYNANGGSVNPGSATYNGTALKLPSPTYSGHNFNGWYTAKSGGDLIGAAYGNYIPR